MSQSWSIREPVPAGSHVAAGKIPLSSWISAVMRWIERRRQWQALSELDDRLLADVGISPEEAFRKAGRPLHDESLAVLDRGHRL